ncbi:ABC transporter substrate-binding protein [Capilliphycus salinus ALCB114379]|uniref:ABC transporter substrate-binding protein n=1 Tax=Capilliphycus salinus TaxID=2768948 RepID=UPI0039A592C7
MSNQKELTTLALALLISGSLLGVGYWLFTRSNNINLSQTAVEGSSSSQTSRSIPPVESLISRGEKSLIPKSVPDEKQAGLTALASRNYQEAVRNFEASLQSNPNDPEALIYLNNARIGKEKAYTMAVAVPIGDANSLGTAEAILRGVAQAQNDINRQGGIFGTPLKVIIADDKNNSEVAEKIAEDLVKNNEILGVVGHYSSGVSLATAPIYEGGKLVAISPSSTSVRLSTAGDYLFRTVPSDRFAANRLAEHMIQELYQQKAVIFYNSQSAYSQSLKDEFTTAVYSDGGEVVNVFDLSDPNFNAFKSLDSAREQGARAILIVPDSPTLEQAYQVVRVNRKQLPILAGDTLYQLDTLKVGGDSEGVIVAVPWHIIGGESEFTKQAAQLWKGDVNWLTAMAYDGTQALIVGIQEQPSRSGIQQALSGSNFSTKGATGVVKFLPSGDRNQTVQLVEVKPGNRSGVGYDFVPVP